MKKIFSAIAAATAIAITGPAHGQSASWYGGVSLGQTKSNVNATEVNDYVRSVGFGSPSTTADNKDQIYKLTLGYRIASFLAMEGFYADVGTYNTRTSVLTPSVGSVSADYKSKGYGIDAVLSAPFSPAFSVYGRVGVFEAKTEAAFSASGSVGLLLGSGDKRKTGQHFGVGLQYEYSPVLAMRGEVESFRKLGDDSTGGELKVDVISLGAIFRF